MKQDKIHAIDIHTHILPPKIPAFKKQFGYGGFIQLEHFQENGCACANMVKDDGQFFRKIESNCFDPLSRLIDMNKGLVRTQVLSTVPVMFSYWTKPLDGLVISQFLNDHMAEVCQKNPQQFLALGTVPMQDPALAAKELRRCIVDLGFKGVQIGSHINDWNLENKVFDEFYQTANELEAAVFIHPWDMMGAAKMPKYWLPWLVGMPAETCLAICSMIFGGVFKRFPKMKVAFAHGGGSFAGTLGRIDHGFQVRPDLCAIDNQISPKDSLGSFFVDSLVHDETALQLIVETFGEDFVLLGSDYPFPLGEENPGESIEKSQLDKQIKEKLLFKNARQWLSLK
jgi:aminocarboxymuconate-semialdehyde decarboxylase